MINIFLIIQIITSFFLVISVILQKESTDSLSGLSGSGLNPNINVRNAETILSKITKYLGIIFFVNCLILSNLAVREGKAKSIIDKIDSKVIERSNLPVGE